MITLVFGMFLLGLSVSSAVTLFFPAIDGSAGKFKTDGRVGMLWALFLLCGIAGFLLLGIIPIP
jgi:hypothetical protein